MMVRDYQGQRYVEVDRRLRSRRDGSQSVLIVWQSLCPVCGEPFKFTTPERAEKFQPNRRCQVHKRPGHRVRGQANG